MKIGYPCINLTLLCRASRTFRLRNYSETRLCKTVNNNLSCLQAILNYNKNHNIRFFRITSDLVPFASHPVNKFPWQEYFRTKFKKIGSFIKHNGMRVTLHPDQFTLINSKDRLIHKRSARELEYHADILDLMQLPLSAKIQIHIGGVYDDKKKSIARFIERFKKLSRAIRRRLVIENDDRSYSLKDCMFIHSTLRCPVVFDVLHHQIHNNGETVETSLKLSSKTWCSRDGLPIIDYSTQQSDAVIGKHAETINKSHFRNFLDQSQGYDFDIMLEIKDKENSALQALKILQYDKRFKKINSRTH
jgi:UV DNA damage endonuclease